MTERTSGMAAGRGDARSAARDDAEAKVSSAAVCGSAGSTTSSAPVQRVAGGDASPAAPATSHARYALGIDIGASSVKLAAVSCGDGAGSEGGSATASVASSDGSAGSPAARRLVWSAREAHQGDPMGTLARLLKRVSAELGATACAGVMATGTGAAALAEFGVRVPVLEDVPAITRGAALIAPEARSVIEIGGQNAYFVALEPGRAPEFAMNESCASGTGSFFEDQMSRLGMRIEDYSGMVERAHSVPRLSGRCSVFAKTDIIHRQQEGVPVEDILLGLCYAMVRSYKALIVRGLPVRPPVVLSGGVALNTGVVRAVREVFELGEDELLTSDACLYLQACGAALEAADRVAAAASTRAAATGAGAGRVAAGVAAGAGAAVPSAKPVPTEDAGAPASLVRLSVALSMRRSAHALPALPSLPAVPLARRRGYDVLPAAERELGPDGRVACTLGIDVGSTSTDLVLLDARGRIVDALYLRTGGDAEQAVRQGLAQLGERMGELVRVVAVATTGSGRMRMGKLVGADTVRDEITAQAAAAAKADPNVDTVFEIGGQDSKFISLRAGQVADFQMNKICAAGTGSFIEEQAARLGIALDDYGELALSSAAPLDLGERCTVFVESAISSALAEGAAKPDVAAGLCLSVVRNYLHRVVGARHVGERIVLQGGVAYNPGIVAAFRASYGDRLTVSPWFAVSGAVGAALLAAEAAAVPGFAGTTFRGWDLSRAAAEHAGVDEREVAANRAFYHKSAELFLAGYTDERDPAKPTVGIPRALLLHRLFPMANAFFRELGFNTYLTPETSDDTIRAAQATCQGETCYPVKLVHGHMAQLAEAGVDYVFMPRVRTIRHEGGTVRHNYACVYMQTAPLIAAKALRFEERGIKLLSPMLDMDFGQAAMAEAMLGVGAELGFSPERSAQAMMAGGFALNAYGQKVEALGDELLSTLAPDERVLVIVTRNYGIADPVLNMAIPEILLDHGQKVITMGHLHGHDVDVTDTYPEMCWPFGQHILGSARIIRRDPRLFAVYLTNHGCGPDSMLSHLFAEEMGDKPYLQIEVDEHASKVGVITRVEAFLNSLDHWHGDTDVKRGRGSHHVSGAAPACGGGGVQVAPPCATPAASPAPAESRASAVAPAVTSVPAATPAPVVPPCGGCGGAGTADDGPEPPLPLELAPVLEAERTVALPDLGPHAHVLAAWLRGRGHAVELVPLSREALEAGREESATKEYLTFTALLGVALTSFARNPRQQLVLPRTRGAEADVQYARVIDGLLAARGCTEARLVAPALETLPWELAGEGAPAGGSAAGAARVDALFACLLAGDVVLAAPPAARAGLLAQFEDAAQAGTLDVQTVCARAADALATATSRARVTLGVVGEWPCVTADALTDGLLARTEGEGVRLVRMPLAEYLWFLWADDLAEERTGADRGSGALAPEELDRRQALLDRLAAQMRAVSEALGGRSAFSADPLALAAAAQEGIDRFAGAGGRYRYAKALELGEHADGVVAVASMYENTDTILRLLRGTSKTPALALAFDGSPGQAAGEQLRSFLYYL